MIRFEEPTLLVIGLLVAVVGALLARGAASKAARGALLACIALAMGGPRVDRRAEARVELHLYAAPPGEADRAALADQLRAHHTDPHVVDPTVLDRTVIDRTVIDHDVIFIEVGEQPRALSPEEAPLQAPTPGETPRWPEALRLALQAAPPDGELRVSVWGDLRGLRPSDALPFQQMGAELAAHPAADLGPGKLLSLALPDGPEVTAGSTLRLAVASGSPVRLSAQLLDSAGRTHDLGAVPEGPEAELQLPAAIAAGPATLLLEEPTAEAGALVHRRALLVSRPPRAWLAAADRGEAASLRGILEAEGAELASLPIDGLGDLPGLATADRPDLLVLAGVGAHRLSGRAQAQIADWVREGGHLVVSGGAEGWELGGWDRAPLGALLPLEADPSGATLDPAVTMLVVLDKSGSMARPAVLRDGSVQEGITARMRGGRPEGSRIRLAAEGVVESVKRLRDNTDFIGILGVDTEPMWLLRPTLITDRAAISQAARNLTAGGGGIYITTAMEAAAPVIRAATTPLKHVVLFADASDVGEQRRAKGGEEAAAFVSALKRDGVTFSVVGIGGVGDRDLLYLQNLARVGGGQAWLAEDPRRLPALFARETERLMGAPPPTALQLRATADRWSPALDRVGLERAPLLTGHHRLRARPGAVVAARTAQGPLLAGARAGLGQTWALATDLGARSARPWLGWSGWATLWANLLRASTSEPGGIGDLEAILTVEPDPDRPGRSRLTLTERDHLGRSRAPFNRSLSVRRADEPSSPAALLPLAVVAPGRWAASALLPANAVLELQPTEPEGAADSDAAPRFLRVTAAEAPLGPLDPAVLAAWTAEGGPRAAPRRRQALWWLFAAAAALLLPVDAWARRRGLRGARG